jgi:WD40 repeat protein
MILSYNTQDGLYDIAWSEIHENQLVTASGDGSLKLWDITIKVGQELGSPCACTPCTLSVSRVASLRICLGLVETFRLLGFAYPRLARALSRSLQH